MKINEKIDKFLAEGYTDSELKRLNIKWLINVQFRDDDGNSTKWLGLNDKEALMALKSWVDKRIKELPAISKKMYG
jgi:hypothetical protein